MTPAEIIQRPHITEKSAFRAEDTKNPVYTFRVNQDANKDQISRAVKTLFKVEPVKIAIVRIPSKQVINRGKKGTQSGYKKAMVYLKAGDKIAFV